MNPRPADYDGVWETDPAKCKTLEPDWFKDLPKAAVNAMDGIANPGSTWPENPNCIYMGGFGLGPMNPVKAFDQELGLWVRSMAFSDGKQTLVTTVIDGEGWLWDYRSKCTDCGAKQIAAALAADPDLAARGVTGASHILHATHSHASPDFIGGWGFVPNWYMKQMTDTIKATAKQAVLSMEAATLEAGEQEARAHNSERRDTYRSAEEASISWVRAVAASSTPPAPVAAASEPAPGKGKKPAPTPAPTETTAPDGPRVIATLGAFAAHPVTAGTNGGVAHPDWVGLFNQRLEERFGGIGMHFMTGLGNLTGANKMTGKALAELLPPVGAGRPVDDTTVKVAQKTATSGADERPAHRARHPGPVRPQVQPHACGRERRGRRQQHPGQRRPQARGPRGHRSLRLRLRAVGGAAGQRRPHRQRPDLHRRARVRCSPTTRTPSRRRTPAGSPSRWRRPTTRSATCRSPSRSTRSASRARLRRRRLPVRQLRGQLRHRPVRRRPDARDDDGDAQRRQAVARTTGGTATSRGGPFVVQTLVRVDPGR
jgi:hypothetical protein